MASGYTSEILNGNVKTLKDFVSVCAKGFGATAHQKDEPLNTPLRNAEPGKAHPKAMRKLKKQLKEFRLMTDKQLYDDEKKALTDTRKHYLSKIFVIKEAKKQCSALLLEAQLWTPPTDDHKVVKDMMVEELMKVIDFDCDINPVNELIEDIDGRISTIDVKLIRENQIKSFEQQIDYHTQSHELDVKHVKQSNNWLSELTMSFE